jgi:integrase
MRLYDLRYSCGSLRAGEGTDPKVIEARLGHASIAARTTTTFTRTRKGPARGTATLNRALSGGVP